jgi:Domain of unknown function (DUF4262)
MRARKNGSDGTRTRDLRRDRPTSSRTRASPDVTKPAWTLGFRLCYSTGVPSRSAPFRGEVLWRLLWRSRLNGGYGEGPATGPRDLDETGGVGTRVDKVSRDSATRWGRYPAAVTDAWRPDKTRLDATDRKLLSDVEQYGWHCLHIHDEDQLPFWSFTVGVVQTWQHPEFVVFGLRDTVAHDLLSQLVERVKAGETISPGRDYDDILEGSACRFVRVDPKWYPVFLGYAQWFYETKDGFPVLQLVWPDKHGRYPGDEDYAITDGSQPVLGSEG